MYHALDQTGVHARRIDGRILQIDGHVPDLAQNVVVRIPDHAQSIGGRVPDLDQKVDVRVRDHAQSIDDHIPDHAQSIDGRVRDHDGHIPDHVQIIDGHVQENVHGQRGIITITEHMNGTSSFSIRGPRIPIEDRGRGEEDDSEGVMVICVRRSDVQITPTNIRNRDMEAQTVNSGITDEFVT